MRKRSSTLWPDGRIRLSAHYTTPLSSLCGHIWMYWISKLLVKYILTNVCLRLTQFSSLSLMHYTGLCVFGLPIYRLMILRISVLYINIIIKLEISPICHCLGLGNEFHLKSSHKSGFEIIVLSMKLFWYSYLCWWTWPPMNPNI